MIIPDFIRRLADAMDNDVITADNNFELLAKLYQRFDDIKKRDSRISFKGIGSALGMTPSFGIAPVLNGVSEMVGLVADAISSEDADEDELEPAQSVPNTDEGLYMFSRKLQEEIIEYEQLHGETSELTTIKKAVDNILSKEHGREVSPSRIVIPRYENIKLEDFGCELSLRPLPKAVLVLFLRHPEGIVLKQRALYYEELLAIYGLFYTKDNIDEFKDSCKRLVDITDGSMDEKITTVNSIFKKNLTISLAEKYQILGKRGGVKSIQLDRSLVKLPKELDRIPLTVIKA